MKAHDLQLLQYCHHEMEQLLYWVATCTCEPRRHPDYIEGLTNRTIKPLAKLIAELKEEQERKEAIDLEKNIQPCPICNRKPLLETVLLFGTTLYLACCESGRCDSFYHKISTLNHSTKKEAVEAWNKLASKRGNRVQ